MLDHGVEAAPELVKCDPKPLAIDLFCGLGGWAEGFLAEGYNVIGFDIEARPYPGSLALQDVLTIHGSQFRHAACLVASPPCQEYSYMAMPWSRSKQIARTFCGRDTFPEGYDGSRTVGQLNALFLACFRIQREASEAAGRYIPLVVENVKGAQPWVGRARANFGSFYLWGDVDSIGGRIVKRNDIRWGAPSVKAGRRGAKVPGMNWSGSDQPGYLAVAFNDEAARRLREGQNPDGRKLSGNNTPRMWEDRDVKRLGDALKVPGFNFHEHEKTGQPGRSFQSAAVANGNKGSAKRFEDTPMARLSSKSDSRKAASAQIAKIPFALASHIARIYKPDTRRTDRQQEACL